MTEAEVRAWAWESSTKRIVAMVEEYCQDWVPNGPSKAAAMAIVNKIRSMPVPGPTGDPQ